MTIDHYLATCVLLVLGQRVVINCAGQKGSPAAI